MNSLTKNLTNSMMDSMMNSALQRAVRKLAGAPDNLPAPAFCLRRTQVAVINVDTPGMDVTSSSQRGIWVQWP
jgi:hypothetical protein